MRAHSWSHLVCVAMQRAHAARRASLAEGPIDPRCAPAHRFALVVGFTMGPFGAVERTWKPFNPILGETFELELKHGAGGRYFAEQARCPLNVPVDALGDGVAG
jgi:Oxysterol-binding protein